MPPRQSPHNPAPGMSAQYSSTFTEFSPVRAADLPQPLKTIVGLLLQHRQAICAYETGVLEIHYNAGRVAMKLVRHLPSPPQDQM
jgi:hypothetical protein